VVCVYVVAGTVATLDVPLVEQPAVSIPSEERTAKRYAKVVIGRITIYPPCLVAISNEGAASGALRKHLSTPE
jgi:hypothetical protein